jgi:transcriptional regulator with GAF, ATPase, and Fis domain
VFIDDRFRDIGGFPPALQGLEAVDFWLTHVHPDDRERLLDQREQLHDGRLEKATVEYRYLHPVHGETWIHHAARVTRRDASGRAIRTFGVVRDITARRRREEALRQSLAEIERLKDRLQAESDYLRAEIRVTHPLGEVAGQSPAIQKLRRLVEQVAPTDSSVLVRGETGSGKELVAQAIHRLGPRHGRLMVKVNCAALPSGLVESELFGREKGAYTGALTRQVGRFEVADGSTLFLDEIGELSSEVQAKLLRVLETGEFERLGSPKTIKVDVRVIAATNRDLVEEIKKGRFREDLYYRLNVFPIRVPPLRERTEDIPLLVWSFLEEFSSRMGKKITQVPGKTMEALQRHAWPGNVRELRNVIEHSAIVTSGDTLKVPMLDDVAVAAARQPTLADSERELILRSLEGKGWRIKGPNGAAAALGLNPSTLYSRMKKLGIRSPGPAAGA